MPQVLLEEAASHLAELISQARSGEEVIIVDDHQPIAKLVPLPTDEPKLKRSGYGAAKDVILYMADDFDEPLEDFKDYM